jgi:hypothetical protein
MPRQKAAKHLALVHHTPPNKKLAQVDRGAGALHFDMGLQEQTLHLDLGMKEADDHLDDQFENYK